MQESMSIFVVSSMTLTLICTLILWIKFKALRNKENKKIVIKKKIRFGVMKK